MDGERLHVAVSCRPPRCGWSWRRVTPGRGFADGTGTEVNASSYRLRLSAILAGLETMEDGDSVTVVTSDESTIRLAEQWIPEWAARGWTKRSIESRDLVMRLATELVRLEVAFLHQKSRTGDPHAKDCKLHARQAAEAISLDAVPPPPSHAEVRGDVECVAWTDGGARKNPGPAGWGFVLVHLASGTTVIRRDGDTHATNNRMELTAIAEALDTLKRRTRIEVRTDSKFAISVCEEWRRGWKRRGWRKANGDAPTNLDVIQRLDVLVDRHDVVFTWVPGHTGEPGNEHADTLCNDAIDAVLEQRDPASLQRAEAPPFPIQPT